MKPSKEDQQRELEQFIARLTMCYIETGKDLTVPEIAELLGWSESKVRKLLNAHGGCPNGLRSEQSERPSYSKSFRSMQAGVHRIQVYGPTRETLRDQIKIALDALRQRNLENRGGLSEAEIDALRQIVAGKESEKQS